VAALTLAVSALASAPAARPMQAHASSNMAGKAFVHWLAKRHPGFKGPSVCPSSHQARQANGGIVCLAEMHKGKRCIQVWATASLQAKVVFRHVSTSAWRRRWSKYSRTHPKLYSPGKVSVNGWGDDWRWLVLGADALCRQKHRDSCTAWGLDGQWFGYDLFFKFHCHTHGQLIVCRNKIGDAMRWRPNG